MTDPTLVTGGCGFVGRHLTERLLSEGREVHVVDNCINGLEPTRWLPEAYDETEAEGQTVYEGPGRLEFYHEDLREWTSRYPERKYADVFHLAAVIGGRETINDQPIRIATDLAIDADFFNWVVSAEPERLLYASSSSAYPTSLQDGSEEMKLDEDHISFSGSIGVPDMMYGWAKLTGEYLSRFVSDKHDISVAIVRPFSGYGGDQSFNYPVPSIARRAFRKEDPLTVWGSGRQVRDFVHIEDCIDAMLRAIDSIDDASAVNIGTGVPTDFLEVASLFAQISGYDPEIQTLPDKPEGPKYRCADPSRMEETLDWSPRITREEGFARVFSQIESRVANEHP